MLAKNDRRTLWGTLLAAKCVLRSPEMNHYDISDGSEPLVKLIWFNDSEKGSLVAVHPKVDLDFVQGVLFPTSSVSANERGFMVHLSEDDRLWVDALLVEKKAAIDDWSR